MALTDKLKAIADAIRSKTDSSDVMTLDEMPEKIAAIEAGSSPTAPYVEETYDESGNLIGAKLVGHNNVRRAAFDSCTNLALISLPESITSIGKSAFSNCTNLVLTSLPESVTSIEQQAFYSCTNLALTSLPESLTSIGKMAFCYCENLVKLTFKGTPTSISADAFYNCPELTVINVPWSEGTVANAPWGATNATVNYRYGG